MRAVVQRVERASVRVAPRSARDNQVGNPERSERVEEKTIARIGKGILVLVGVGKDDNSSDAKYLANKITNLRLFEDEEGKMNLSLKEVDGEILAVSQFTLYGDCRKGNRPSFTEAADLQDARRLYQEFVDNLRASSLKVETGEFQARMLVSLENDGPVTLILEA